jgi:hypothetical protein
VKGQLLVAIAVLGAPHAGDSRGARQLTRRRGEAAGLTGDDVESAARHRGRRAGRNARSVAPCTSVARLRRRRQGPIEHDQPAVGPPGPERGVNLQPERARSAQTGGATEPLKRNQRPHAEREVHDMGAAARLERVARRPRDHPLRVPVERVGGAVRRLGAGVEAIEKRPSARTDDQRAGRARQQLVERQRLRRDVERRARQRENDVEAELAERTRERRQQLVG